MSTKVAINGLGRIGRAILKLLVEEPGLELVAVNDLVEADNLSYLLRFDTVYGRYSKPVLADDGQLTVAGRELRTLRKRDPAELPWRELGVDVVFECTGALKKREDLEKHIRAGAKYVLLSAPTQGAEVETVVHGANVPHGELSIISCASCTTNCITPIVEVIGRRIGLKKAVMTTIHAYTSSQSIVDGASKSFRRGRAGAVNLVPATTGAALATTRALPEYAGLFDLIPLPRDWLRPMGQGGARMLFVTRGRGHSMEPTIGDGDIVIVDRAQLKVEEQDQIWAIGYGGLGMMIKRLRRLTDGNYSIMSDNPSVAPYPPATEDEIHIIGRVVWAGREM